jgi:hypothetical protein
MWPIGTQVIIPQVMFGRGDTILLAGGVLGQRRERIEAGHDSPEYSHWSPPGKRGVRPCAGKGNQTNAGSAKAGAKKEGAQGGPPRHPILRLASDYLNVS